jgi:four helix bundle protein
MYGLKSQMRRCAVSVSSNIAEGQGRSTRGEFHQFLGHARGSLYELETQTGNCGKTWLHRTVRSGLFVRKLGRMLNALIASLKPAAVRQN